MIRNSLRKYHFNISYIFFRTHVDEKGRDEMSDQEKHYEELKNCPWCDSVNLDPYLGTVHGGNVVKCRSCELIFAQRRLNSDGLTHFFRHYLTNTHIADKRFVEYRNVMYQLEFNLINQILYPNRPFKILDVGCSGGYFLDLFKKNGFQCFGVEIGEEAVKEASKKHKVWQGEFTHLDLEEKFDLIVFRGVLQYVPFPKQYLQKAKSVLEKQGYIYITSTPNFNSFCAKLFEDKWNFYIGSDQTDYIGFTPKHFDDFFKNHNFIKRTEYFFYEETPYANVEEDILKVSEAIRLKKEGKEIKIKSPAYWGNLMSLVFQKFSD
jgi:SAM-dependent methyltransferase